MFLHLFDVAGAALRRRVASVGTAVYENLLHALPFTHFEQGIQVCKQRVNAAVARKTYQVQAVRARVPHSIQKNGILKELALRDHAVDTGDIHVDDAACSYVQVADLAVAHLPLGQTDSRPGGLHQCIRVGAKQSIVCWFAGRRDGVTFAGR
jgi:hypothetical protein